MPVRGGQPGNRFLDRFNGHIFDHTLWM
jgi:hypothetical protein